MLRHNYRVTQYSDILLDVLSCIPRCAAVMPSVTSGHDNTDLQLEDNDDDDLQLEDNDDEFELVLESNRSVMSRVIVCCM